MKKKTLNKFQEKYRKDLKMNAAIKNQPKNKPYVDQQTAQVYWGTDAKAR